MTQINEIVDIMLVKINITIYFFKITTKTMYLKHSIKCAMTIDSTTSNNIT